MADPTELERVLAALDADDHWASSADAARLLREMARDFDEYADHGLSELGQSCLRADFGMTGKCSCGYEQAKERWRLP